MEHKATRRACHDKCRARGGARLWPPRTQRRTIHALPPDEVTRHLSAANNPVSRSDPPEPLPWQIGGLPCTPNRVPSPRCRTNFPGFRDGRVSGTIVRAKEAQRP
eukprot:364902-Chlamydomonas_euryale.AAC.9